MKYISKKSNKWVYRTLLLFFSIWVINEIVQIYESIRTGENFTLSGLIIPFLLCLLLTKLNTVSYDNINIYIINYTGVQSYSRVDFDKIIPVTSFLNFHRICFKSIGKKYLFFAGNMNIIGSLDSEEVAKQLTLEIKQSNQK